MLLADAGKSQTQICAELKCSVHTARHWIYIAQSGRAHQWDQSPVGRPKEISEAYRNRLREVANGNPREYGYPFKNWTGQWLGKHLAKEFGIKVSGRHISRLLKEMGLSTRQKREDEPNQTPFTPPASLQIKDLNTERFSKQSEKSLSKILCQTTQE
jgi:putative transposase